MRWRSLQRRNILLLADLHYCEYKYVQKVPFLAPGWKAVFAGMPKTNLRRLLHFISTVLKEDLHHIIILGDVTVTGTTAEFVGVAKELLGFQNKRFGPMEYSDKETGCLNPEVFTVIPGNHDLNWKSWGACLLSPRIVGSVFMAWLAGKRQKYFHYRTVPKQSQWKMRLLLQLFDKYFGNTISNRELHPTKRPNEFGLYEKALTGTNICLVPMNTCVSHPVTRVGLNAAGVLLDNQINNLNALPSSERPGAESFRIGLAHHFPLPVPLASDLQDRYLELHDAAEIFASLYSSGRFAAFLCGHKHKDFVWTNSTTVPQVKRTLPVITVGSTTFGLASDEHLCCLLEIEDRDMMECSAATTLMRLRYYQLTQHTSKLVATEEIIPSPDFYREFMRTTRDRVQEGRRMPGTLVRFFDFSEEEVKRFMELPSTSAGDVKLEFSRWGTRLYGDSQGELATFDMRIDADPYEGRVGVRLSCREADTSANKPELWIDSDQAERPQRLVPGAKSELLADLVLREIRSDTRIRVSFRTKGPAEVVFHYLRVSTAI